MESYIIILKIYTAAALVPVAIYFLTRKYQHPSMVYLAAMLIFSFLADGFALVNHSWLHLGKTINAVSNFYGCLEPVVVIMLYQRQISPAKRSLFVLIMGLLVTTQLAEMLIRGVTEFPGTSRSAFAIVVTIFALLYFFQLIRKLPAVGIYRIPMFWINIGMLVYFTGNFFLFVVRDYLVEVMKNNMIFYWSFHNLLGICAYILFAIGLWQARWSGEKMVKADV